jgi:transaldolase
MIEIPGTAAGTAAIRRATAAGINVNVTLLFSVAAYTAVATAFLEGLEERVARDEPIAPIASVASFFVSRVDTEVDRRLVERARGDLSGRAGIANARIAYARFGELFGGERFAALAAHGARVQRPLWASTGVKDPSYRDVMYVGSRRIHSRLHRPDSPPATRRPCPTPQQAAARRLGRLPRGAV